MNFAGLWMMSLGCLGLAYRGFAEPRCADTDATVLAIGDSFQRWGASSCASIPDHVSEGLGVPVLNAAISGALLTAAPGTVSEAGVPVDIRAQYIAGNWDWVLVDGGGNDVNSECGCGGCEATLEDLVSEEGTTGAMVELIDEILGDGAQVVLLDYFELPEGAWYGFDTCDAVFQELEDRYRRLADNTPGVLFVDAEAVVSPETTPEAYDTDRVHPSKKGTALIGAYVAEQIKNSSNF